MTDEIELKPCPFCGGKAKCIEYYGLFHVICCDCYIAGRDRPSIDGAIDAWNARPIEDALREVLEKYASGKNYIGVSSEGEPFEFEENAYGLEEMKIGWAARQALKGTGGK